jgi:hypothetical protein
MKVQDLQMSPCDEMHVSTLLWLTDDRRTLTRNWRSYDRGTREDLRKKSAYSTNWAKEFGIISTKVAALENVQLAVCRQLQHVSKTILYKCTITFIGCLRLVIASLLALREYDEV